MGHEKTIPDRQGEALSSWRSVVWFIVAHAGNGILKESDNNRKKNKEPLSEEGGSCSLVVQYGLNDGMTVFSFISGYRRWMLETSMWLGS